MLDRPTSGRRRRLRYTVGKTGDGGVAADEQETGENDGDHESAMIDLHAIGCVVLKKLCLLQNRTLLGRSSATITRTTTDAAEIVRAVKTAKQFLTFTHNGPFQLAIAAALDLGDDFYVELAADFRRRRDLLCDGLAAAGFEVARPQGTYCVNVDIRSVGASDGIEFCLGLPERVGVVAIPTQVFYDNTERGRHLARFTFCKTDAVLEDGISRLSRLSS